ncbi:MULTISPECIES: hypothetical protein [Pseudomonas]|uniref:hypothetical protein n=1 Tax=Pseudomonas TaxID=286 RepID=UPI00070FCA10|nr:MULTISPECIES: hypothetical protein [Pseudomonas]KQW20005.1 TrfA [Pseudomonas sp. Root401]WHS57603.1 TrfA [Pseudomonas brassicacearum]WNZ87317.1 TrfA [Pseudomonas sp. P108]
MTDELELTPEEIQRGIIDSRKSIMRDRFEQGSGQGILPFTNERFFEQSNPILRSSLFTAGKVNIRNKSQYLEWTEIFSLGSGSIHYRGPVLTVDHEIVLVKLMVLARGRSITKPIHATQADVLRWLDLDANSGANYVKARRILDDLEAGELKVSSKPALRRLLSILTSPNLSDMADGAFFQQLVKNRYESHLGMIAHGLENDHDVDITLSFIQNVTHNPVTKRMMINLDPLAAVFFDGVNTTLLPFEIWDKLDRFGKKLLPLIASHRDGVFPIKLERYFEFSGSKSEYGKVKRRFKSEQKKRFAEWEEKGYIVPGWNIERNREGEEIVSGLRAGDAVRIRSTLDLMRIEDTDEEIARGSEQAIQERFEGFENHFMGRGPAPEPAQPKKPRAKKPVSN